MRALEPAMYPVTHATIAVGAVKAGERLFPVRWLPLDYRFAAFGSLLPDLIDKPIGWFLVPSLPDDHLWGHTVWLAVLLIVPGLWLAHRTSNASMVLVGLGVMTHLIVDPVNLHPRTLFWPLLGWTFPDVRGYLLIFPITLEIVLIGVLLWTGRHEGRVRQRVGAFLAEGTV
jgi:hypothetical protein